MYFFKLAWWLIRLAAFYAYYLPWQISVCRNMYEDEYERLLAWKAKLMEYDLFAKSLFDTLVAIVKKRPVTMFSRFVRVSGMIASHHVLAAPFRLRFIAVTPKDLEYFDRKKEAIEKYIDGIFA